MDGDQRRGTGPSAGNMNYSNLTAVAEAEHVPVCLLPSPGEAAPDARSYDGLQVSGSQQRVGLEGTTAQQTLRGLPKTEITTAQRATPVPRQRRIRCAKIRKTRAPTASAMTSSNEASRSGRKL